MVKVNLNSDSSVSDNSHPLAEKTRYELKDLLKKRYGDSSVDDLDVAFFVNTENDLLLVHWDRNEGDFVAVPIQYKGEHHFLKEDGSY